MNGTEAETSVLRLGIIKKQNGWNVNSGLQRKAGIPEGNGEGPPVSVLLRNGLCYVPMQRIIQNSNKRLKDWEARQKNKSGSSQCPSRRKNCNSLQQDDAPGLEKKEASDADDASGLMA